MRSSHLSQNVLDVAAVTSRPEIKSETTAPESKSEEPPAAKPQVRLVIIQFYLFRDNIVFYP